MDTVPGYTLKGDAPQSVSFWLKMDEVGLNQNIFSHGASSGQDFAHVKIGSQGVDVRVEYGGFSSQVYLTSLAAGTWYHFAVTYAEPASKTYWDGSLTLTHALTLDTQAEFANIVTTFSNGADFRGRMKDLEFTTHRTLRDRAGGRVLGGPRPPRNHDGGDAPEPSPTILGRSSRGVDLRGTAL